MAKITDTELRQRPGAADKWLCQTIIWGHGQLEARITPAGDRSFYFRYINADSKRVRLELGTYAKEGGNGHLSLKAALQKAQKLAALHKSGVRDLREHIAAEEAAKVAAREAEAAKTAAEAAQLAARRTVREVFNQWASVELIRHKDQGKEVRRMMEQHALPVIGHLMAADVRKNHIAEVIDPMLARGTPRMAKIIFGKMRQLFGFAIDRGICEIDPTAGIKKARIGGRDVERDRFLSDDEIRELAGKAPAAGLLPSTSAAIWIALSTGARIGELLGARWADVDLDGAIWKIPETKTGRPHQVYLSDFAARQFLILRTLSGRGEWVYPNRDDDGPVNSKTITKQIGDRQLEEGREPMKGRSANARALQLSGGRWTMHDLRRTMSTTMSALGVAPAVIEKCLNHTEQNKIQRIYQRYDYKDEQREAWRLVGTHLEILTRPGTKNVVTMATAKRRKN